MQWKIIDDNGVIHSGTEDEMKEAWMTMCNRFPNDYTISRIRKLQHKWDCLWEGDLKLVQIHDIYR